MEATAALEVVDGAAVVRVTGEVDIATAGCLADVLRSVSDEGLDVVLDLSRVTLLDVVGLRPIDEARRRLEAHGRSISIRGASGIVLRLLQLTDLGALVAA
jgi:anti-anti-sigma factor